MAVCKVCGHNYVSKECIKCKSKKETVNKILGKKNNKKAYSNIALIFFLLISITTTGMMYLKIKETITKNENQARVIKKLEFTNNEMKKRLKQNEDLISRYQNNSKQLAHENARLKRNTNRTSVKPKTYAQNLAPERTYIKPEIFERNKTSKTQRTNNSAVKKYYKYRGYERLVSDSKISIKNDNRFSSNAPIFGNYKHPISSKITCNNKKNIYKVVNECKTYSSIYRDILYLSISNVNSVKNFNINTHMIECHYNKKHGLMHDCKVKLKSI